MQISKNKQIKQLREQLAVHGHETRKALNARVTAQNKRLEAAFHLYTKLDTEPPTLSQEDMATLAQIAGIQEARK